MTAPIASNTLSVNVFTAPGKTVSFRQRCMISDGRHW